MNRLNIKLFCVVFVLSGCVSNPPWETYKSTVQPDYSCFIGPTEAGCDVYIWKCHNNQRTVVYQCGTAFLMPQSSQEHSACGGVTSYEMKNNLNEHSLKTCEKAKRIWPNFR